MKVKKKNRIIISICCAFIALVSVFSFIPFKSDKQVKADTVTSDYLFSGSNISSTTTFDDILFSYNLFNINNYNTFIASNGIEYSGFLASFLTVGDVYTISFSEPVYWFKISDSASGYNSVEYFSLNGFYSYTFTMSRNSNIPSSSLQYIFIGDSTQFPYSFNYLNTIDILVTAGSSVLPYVPYQDSIQVNYDFDFRVLNGIHNNFTVLQYGVNYNIQDSLGYNYAVVGAENGNNIYNIDYIVNIAHSFLPSIWWRWAYRYDFSTSEFDRNYGFKFLQMFDYIESYNTNIPFNGNVKYVVLGSYKDRDTYFHLDSISGVQDAMDFAKYEKYNFISYVDENGNNLNFIIPLNSPFDSNYWTFRTYFLTNEDLNSSVYTKGYTDGFVNGENKGYTDGYVVGKSDGYNLGYNTAVGNEKYSFNGLLTSVIDVPVKTFTSLFNFEILGVNLSGFFLGLLTCSVVITIVRLLL